MPAVTSHLWVRGGLRTDRHARIESIGLPPELVAPVDAHQRLRGPYTAAGTVVRALVPDIVPVEAEIIRRYDIEILSVAPELSAIVPGSRETLTSMAIPKERTRFYAPLRTRRISNGLVELIRDSLPNRARSLVLENVEHAESTDLEFIAALLRRVDPSRLTIVVCTGSQSPPSPELRDVLGAHAVAHEVNAGSGALSGDRARVDAVELARRYVHSDCTSDDPDLFVAYDALDPEVRAQLHDQRAAALEELDLQSLRLGAIPFHLEHGRDPAGKGAKALRLAQDYCACMGFYTAVADYGERALAIVDAAGEPALWWGIAGALALALSLLSRTREAEKIYDQARLVSTSPDIHMAAAYSTAMLYTRHHDPADRDDRTSKRWLNSAIATASLLEDPTERAFQSAFYKNGLALVEVNLGEPVEALRLVDDCISSLDRLLGPDEHRLHRSVLKNNRARVYASLGMLIECLDDYAVVIAEDPNHAEHYLERGNVLRRMSRFDEAFADYETAIRLSPPFPEIYYNRADLRAITDDIEGALADFSYVIELEPGFVDAYANRAGLYLELGDLDRAGADATAGLARDSQNGYLLVVAGQVHVARQEYREARTAYDRAVKAAPDLVAAWSGRAELACELGDFAAAIEDLDRAIELQPDDASLRYNRAFAYQKAGSWTEALGDLELAATLAPDDEDIAAASAECRLHLTAS
jgi:tetratricopeptide (TPR) repeat protein